MPRILKVHRPGDQITLVCPGCDGVGYDDSGQKCKDCNGSGKVQGTVSKGHN